MNPNRSNYSPGRQRFIIDYFTSTVSPLSRSQPRLTVSSIQYCLIIWSQAFSYKLKASVPLCSLLSPTGRVPERVLSLMSDVTVSPCQVPVNGSLILMSALVLTLI